MEKKRNRKIKYRTLICSAAGAFFCGFGANWGSQLDRNGNVAVTDLYSWLIPFLTACVLTPVFYLVVVEKLTGIEASGDRQVSHSNKKAPDAGQQLQRGWKKLFQSPILRYASSCSYAGCRYSLRSIQAFLPMMRRTSCRRC